MKKIDGPLFLNSYQFTERITKMNSTKMKRT